MPVDVVGVLSAPGWSFATISSDRLPNGTSSNVSPGSHE